MPTFVEVACDAAERAGQILLDWRHRFKAQEKGPRDLVTEADLAAQEAIRATIAKAFPAHDFLGEEDAAKRKSQGLPPIPERQSDFRWIVDPLDGTTNYVHRLPGYAVSIALQIGNELELGVIFDPLGKECYVAERGKGATRNGERLQASGCTDLGQALVAVSFSAHVTRESLEIRRFTELLLASQSIRRMGSAALNLCHVAAGQLDAYVATSIHAWDVAAGLVILQEAGGYAASLTGGPLSLERPEMLAGSTKPLVDAMVAVIQGADAMKSA